MRLKAYIKNINKIVDVGTINFTKGYLYYYDSDKHDYVEYHCKDTDDILNSNEIKLLKVFSIVDKNLRYLCEGDIVDIHQTVNGEHLFIITYSDFGGIVPVYYSNLNRTYEYNVKELLEFTDLDKEMGTR